MDRISFSEALSAVIAQRLVRTLCENCKKSFKPDKEQFDKLRVAYGTELFEKHGMESRPQAFKQRVGCTECDQVGYRGRRAIFEMLECTDKIKKGIKEKASTEELRAVALEEGMRTLRMDAIEKIFRGVTDLEEILRVC